MPLGINGKEHTAPGFRNAGNETGWEGITRRIGRDGFSYSSSVSGSNGVYLNFYVTNLNPSNSNYRAYGFQLRCLSE
ncbi:hypothetical protein [uncultured Rikenella sp.]|uniref:hypothetical protein n=1 Tax=uncultured Rikenella sp. TaxID=368003 RepID=UPI0026073D75|nr:hypothetical protein [uncultured Rikenella sp.]